MSEEPGFTPNSPLTRKPKPNRLFLKVLGYFAAVAVGTAIVARLFGEQAAILFALFWLFPVYMVGRSLWYGLPRQEGAERWFDRIWRRWS